MRARASLTAPGRAVSGQRQVGSALLSRNPPPTTTQRDMACFILDVPTDSTHASPQTTMTLLCWLVILTSYPAQADGLDCTQTKEKSFCECCNQSGPRAVRNSLMESSPCQPQPTLCLSMQRISRQAAIPHLLKTGVA